MTRILFVGMLLQMGCALISHNPEVPPSGLVPDRERSKSKPPPAPAASVKTSENFAPEVFPVPTTSRCIVIMVCQYMVIYTALAVCRTYQEFTETGKGPVEKGLRAAAQTLTYGPMLCVLFIACRMRVEFLSDGEGQPQIWVQHCMYALTFAVLASTILVLLMPLLTGQTMSPKKDALPCDLEALQDMDNGKLTFYVLTACRYLILLGLYGGLAGVIVGICIYKPPGANDLHSLPPPAPAIMCTMILAIVFFLTQLVIAGCRTYNEFMGVDFPKIVAAMNAAANTVEFAPMLAILFLAARMRALQHDGQPQYWAQNCMYAATAAMIMTTILAVIVPLTLGGKEIVNPVTGQRTFDVPDPTFGYIIIALRFLSMACFYGGVVGVMISIFTFEAPAGPDATLPVSPTVQCVINLTFQFFFVYLVLIVCQTVSEVSGGRIPLDQYRLFAAIDACKSTLGFAPMLAILFVTTRMYALLITDKRGAPQGWVQDGMYMATWALLISFLCCLMTGFVMDEVHTDEDGNVVNKFSNSCAAAAMTVLRYFTMLLLYGGIVTVVVGLFVMTPETANGRGSIPLVSDAVNATPFGSAPPGPNNVAQVGSSSLHISL